MKKHIFPILITALLVFFSSCEKKWEAPEFNVPHFEGVANKTIADIINVYVSNGNKMDSITHAGEPFIVKAVVVSSDEGGNFYKNMVVQDETGAIQIQINKSGLCHTYPVGQTVYINCEGLVVGNYHGVYQIGWIYNGEVGRIDGNFLDQYLIKDGMPQEVAPLDITSKTGLNEANVCRLVRIHNCEFADEAVGMPWSEETSTTSRYLKSINGESVNNIVVRTSNYSKIRKGLVPSGSGDLIGILSIYNDTYQLMLRTLDDVLPFGTLEEIKTVSLNDNSCEVTNTDAAYGWRGYNGYMAHPSATGPANDWLVSPAISASEISGSTLYVEQQLTSIGAEVADVCTILYTTNYTGNPETTEWHQLQYTPNVDGTFHNVQCDGLNNLSGNVRFAFHYQASSSCGGQWGVKGLHFQKIVSH